VSGAQSATSALVRGCNPLAERDADDVPSGVVDGHRTARADCLQPGLTDLTGKEVNRLLERLSGEIDDPHDYRLTVGARRPLESGSRHDRPPRYRVDRSALRNPPADDRRLRTRAAPHRTTEIQIVDLPQTKPPNDSTRSRRPSRTRCSLDSWLGRVPRAPMGAAEDCPWPAEVVGGSVPGSGRGRVR
jgi:hypothetical protein